MKEIDDRTQISLGSLVAPHWRLILVCMLASGLLGAAATEVLPKKFLAEAEFLVRDTRQNLVMMTSPNGTPAPGGGINEEQVNSEMQLLQSRDLLQTVVADAGLYTGGTAGGVATDPQALERAISTLRKNLNVSAVRKTDIIAVQLTANSPEKATEMLVDLTRLYQAASIRAHGSPSSYAFFAAEAAP